MSKSRYRPLTRWKTTTVGVTFHESLGPSNAIADPRAALAWGSTATLLAMFATVTRMHERYLFPALPLSIIAAVLMPRLRATAVVLHVAYALNMHLAYTNGASSAGWLQSAPFWRLNGRSCSGASRTCCRWGCGRRG